MKFDRVVIDTNVETYRCIRIYVWFNDDQHVIWMWIWIDTEKCQPARQANIVGNQSIHIHRTYTYHTNQLSVSTNMISKGFSFIKFVVETISYISVCCFVDCYLSFCPFSFGYCTVCPSSIYGFCLPLLVSSSIYFYNNIQFCFLEVSLALSSLCRLRNMNTDLQQRATHIESLQRAMQELQYQIAQKDDKIKDFKREAEDLRTR